MHKSTTTILVTAFLCSLGGCQPQNAFVAPPPPKVTVANPTVETITLFVDENGETEAVEQAVVRARVQGILEKIGFEPDDRVSEGDQLYLIEQSQFEAAVRSSKADISSAKAELGSARASIGVANAQLAATDAAIKVAQAEFNRNDKLLKSNAVSQSEWDTANAAREQALAAREGATANLLAVESTVAKAEAVLEKATADLRQTELELEWTVVVAPISGRVMRTDVKRGNLVENGTELVTIIQGEQIWANFNISERMLLELERRDGREDGVPDLSKFAAFLQRAGDEGYPFEGHLDFVDAQIDPATGTLGIRAVFQNDNPNRRLIPGMFVRVRVPIGIRENALLIPEKAIGKDQVGSYVYVVDSNNKVERRNIVPGPRQGAKIVIDSGLEKTDLVITEGIQRARPGGEVDPSGN